MIYTKTGDKGTTSLVGGTRVPKYDLRVEGYGTLDELNCHLGLVRDLIIKRERQLGKSTSEVESNTIALELLSIINIIFSAQAIVANEKGSTKTIPPITDQNISLLEKRIDLLEKELPKLQNFILPTGYYISTQINIARAICRRAERLICKLNDESEINPQVLIFINRLSDYLFVIARKIMIDRKKEEILWQP
ncbi:MAG: cob(I)yrinic acid a,c-diamide adenosyltransferase [Bacteroidales bacterium]|nr:cob(I)yrinic acid a,c-diamide adenosyltransferase [Bacteroidales bacterium]MDD4001330.1 cob(I)yrinic acid a,c-diamide adenosyltransferase [Bacteroidales bacterium]